MANNEQSASLRLMNQLADLNTSLIELRLSRGGNANMTTSWITNKFRDSEPSTLRELLSTMIGEQLQVTTPFGDVSGTLISVQDDYIVMVDDTGAQALVRIDAIEFVSEL
ncbi:DUF2642 domain-containing protein [Salicibibacter cibarius]|uniref:DUF2642 domain-containing protein n=1 Tax=Salicibibacter cibarius TaxID=2743000 RepID=A0A7T6Z2C3_9BACI|nr:DUF2642 domain-containing protein [Salicibibacter cibarius]QQK75705.1 DUF2642 domain-containing protein [Salicibibacter cibarius]